MAHPNSGNDWIPINSPRFLGVTSIDSPQEVGLALFMGFGVVIGWGSFFVSCCYISYRRVAIANFFLSVCLCLVGRHDLLDDFLLRYQTVDFRKRK